MTNTEFTHLLEDKKNKRLKWSEPYPAKNELQEKIQANIKLCATVEDCINIRRLQSSELYGDIGFEEEDLLAEFIAINWATIE
jgi:hypothetical protein